MNVLQNQFWEAIEKEAKSLPLNVGNVGKRTDRGLCNEIGIDKYGAFGHAFGCGRSYGSALPKPKQQEKRKKTVEQTFAGRHFFKAEGAQMETQLYNSTVITF